MTDIEKRAHDLAISFTQYKETLEFFEEGSLKMIDFENDYFDEYKGAYAVFKNLLEDE